MEKNKDTHPDYFVDIINAKCYLLNDVCLMLIANLINFACTSSVYIVNQFNIVL